MHPIAERAASGAEPIATLVADFYGPEGPMADAGWEVRPQQREMSLDIAAGYDARESGQDDPQWTVHEATTGCHAKGQLVMLHTGRLVRVEDVCVGDMLMGPDGSPREVLRLIRGEQEMVDIVPTKGESWRVNLDHVLTIFQYPQRGGGGALMDVTVRDFVSWSKWAKHRSKLVRCGVASFGGGSGCGEGIPPYVLGALLGDGYLPGTPGSGGTKAALMFSGIDEPVIDEVRSYIQTLGMRMKSVDARHHIITGERGYGNNPLRRLLVAIGLSGTRSATKFIPPAYKTAPRDERLELLAGLMDTDGCSNGCGGFDYISKSKRLANDVAFVARSLGLAAYIKQTTKSSQTGFTGTYWRVSISGDCSVVPVRIDRKRCPPRQIKKNPLRVGFSVVPTGTVEEFYGFTLSGDGRFLLGDFTITHNSGKGMAYLVPGVLFVLRARAKWEKEDKDRRTKHPPQVVVSTANIALQEQLIGKDLPALCEMLDVDLRYMLLKGRNNYVCRREIATIPTDLRPDDRDRYDRIMRELDRGWDGDKESLTWDPGSVWSRVSRTSSECGGQGCVHYKLGADAGTCFWRIATKGAKQAHVVVVNHHLLALQGGLNACLLAVDEMHELEGAIRSAVSDKLTRGSGRALADRAKKLIGEDEARVLIKDPVDEVMDALTAEFELVNPRRQRWPDAAVLKPGWAGDRLTRACKDVMTAFDEARRIAIQMGGYEVSLGHIRAPAAKGGPEAAEAAREVTEACRVANALFALHCRVWSYAHGRPSPHWPGHDRPWALYVTGFWAQDSGIVRVTGHAAPADVSWAVKKIQTEYPVAAMTSATVPAFDSLRLTFGMPKQGQEVGGLQVEPWRTEKRLPSPYDLPNMGVLVVPRGPSPKAPAWREWAAGRVVDLVRASEGRALILASSNAQMRLYGEALRNGTSYPVKVQGEEGRATLRAWFRENVEGVLVATRSFFQGLDVQGESCALVVIDRIPFARPGDPVEDAVQRLLVERAGGGSGYLLRSIPDAAMVLAQGAGRLIRSSTDRGAVALLDNRILKAAGGWATLKRALPPFPLSFAVEDVANVLSDKPLVGVPGPIRARSSRVRFGG